MIPSILYIKIDGFRPYVYQSLAWKRLSEDSGESTIIATGTGSGKNECFLYPVLDYCARQRGSGIKALRYLVVDELHSFDGAQGTDLACLIRRLRERRQRESDFLEGSFVIRISLPGPERMEKLRPFGGDEDPHYLDEVWLQDET